jgi:class 3 adenylate cyclase
MTPPETKYVRVGEADLAYQVVGGGPRDLLWIIPLGGQLDLLWQIPQVAEFLNGLASFCRLIIFDRRGSGASDPLPQNALPTWEELAEDMTAVLDAAGSNLADVMATHETGPIGILFANMHPERVGSLVLINTEARYIEANDYAIGLPAEAIDAFVEFLETGWGTQDLAAALNPGLADDPVFTSAMARMFRASATPRMAATLYRYYMHNIDVRDFLQLVQVPTLVLHVRECPFSPHTHGQYMAEHIPGASFIELPGADITQFDEHTVSDIAEFLTGERPVVEVDRVLTTVLFTDIVGSTAKAAAMGDQLWRRLLDTHDQAVRDELRRFRGREIKTTGDGFFASFDGPARGIRCARAITGVACDLGIEIRAGLHTGECEVRGDDLGGLAVHIAARVGVLAAPGEVVVSGTVKDLVVGSGIEFEDRGDQELKGVPGTWKLFAVEA